MKSHIFNLNLINAQESAQLEVIFQITPRPDGTTIQKTSMEMQISSKTIWEWFFRRRRKENLNIPHKKEVKPDNNIINNALTENTFNCIFCKEVSCFRFRWPSKYERHLKSKHKVLFEIDILYLVNFFNKEKKKNIINEAKKSIKKGDIFQCTLCQGVNNFVVGEFEEFKTHLAIFHKISYEAGFILAISYFSEELKTLTLNGSAYPKITNKQENLSSEKKCTNLKQTQDQINITCNLCMFTTLSARPMQIILRHKTKYHNVCQVCETKFENRKVLTLHFRSIHWVGDNRVKCAIDGCKQVTNEKYMHLHVQRHHKDKILFKCDEIGVMYGESYHCDKEYTSSSELRKHIEKGHIVFKPRTPEPKKRKEISSVPCTFCGIMIKESLGYMSSHIKRVHGNRPLIYCLFCKFTTTYPKYMKTHEAGHLGTIICEICDTSYRSRPLLKKHQVIVHGDGEDFLCSLCNFKTWNPTRLRIHEKCHNEKTIKCDQCDYKGTSKDNLRIHQRRHKDPRYICDECDYKTYDTGNFHTHKTVKHGSVVLHCELCPDYSSKSARSLRKHQERHV